MKIPARIQSKIIERKNILQIKKEKVIRPLVFTNGCFDILHNGHINYLLSARELGNFLWIGLNSDSSVKKLKGEKRPINHELSRATLLASLFFVDAVTIFDEDTPISLIDEIRPDIHVKGGDYQKEKLPEYKSIIEYGGKVEILPFVEGESTSGIISRIVSKN
ncbi:MAG: D-glycero-beta-D-manno-heptose 1-phosphate adenylyltransferase [Leptospiraceae bacterium]|nr:D-glycero-beta-D-manno-heptose 1-phosphate adenylyltransferase [Leptospiraceae bacterium]MCP5512139.1 D-glycero-beta-D-manno-heptose 1-phosphate adenylyltransferase [Leptospiraceae bacterium]